MFEYIDDHHEQYYHDGGGKRIRASNYDPDFEKDPLYHHHLIKFDSILQKTKRAYCFEVKGKDFWVARKLCKKVNKTKKRAMIWRGAAAPILEYITMMEKANGPTFN